MINTNCYKNIYVFFYLKDFYCYLAVVVLMPKENMLVVKTSDRNKSEGQSPPWARPLKLVLI